MLESHFQNSLLKMKIDDMVEAHYYVIHLTLCVRSSRIRDRRNLTRAYDGHESVTHPGASREYGCHEFVTSSFPLCYYSYRARSTLKLSVAYIVYILQSLFYKISLIK